MGTRACIDKLSTNCLRTPHTHTDSGRHAGLQGGMNSLRIAEICGQSAVVAVLKEQYLARALPLPVDLPQGKERVQKAWRDAGNVVVLEHVASGALYEDYTMLFGNFNTFKADMKLSAGKFYYELDIKHIQGVAQRALFSPRPPP